LIADKLILLSPVWFSTVLAKISTLVLAAALSTCFSVALAAPAAKPAHKPAPGSGQRPAANNGPSVEVQNAYLARLRGKLGNNWMLPDGINRVEVTAMVNADGTVDTVKLVSTPKSDPAEQAAADSFSKSQPLETLPSGFAMARLILVFSSKADPHGDTSSNITSKFETVATPKPSTETK